RSARPRPVPLPSSLASCSSYMSRYMVLSPSIESPKLVLRIDLSIIRANCDSSSRAAVCNRSREASAGCSGRAVAEGRRMAWSLDHLELGAQSTYALKRFQDGNDVARGGADRVHRPHDGLQRAAPFKQEHAVAALADLDRGLGHHRGDAVAEGARLAYLCTFNDRHGKRTMRDRCRQHGDMAAHDHRAGAGIDDDFGRGSAGADVQGFQLGQKADAVVRGRG